MNDLMEIKVQGYQIIEKTVKSSGNSGRVYVPKDWIGKKVKIVLLETIKPNSTVKNEENR